jgi:endoglucanase
MAVPKHRTGTPLPNRRNVLAGAVAATVPLGPFAAIRARSGNPSAAPLRGVALAGAEFGQLMPGQIGRDYIYPGPTDFKYCATLGFTVVRLPFKWERLQPDLYKPFDKDEWDQVAASIKHSKQAGLTLILDPHNYAHRRVRDDDFTVDHVIGSERVPVAAFTSFWRELAQRTKDQSHVIYGMMNEPADIEANAWRVIANQTLLAIRETGAGQLVLVPGVAYTGAHSWYPAGNTVLEGLRDPANHFAIEVHQYLDGDSSGRSGAAVSETIGAERLQAFQAWARDHKLKAFLGEFGAGSDAVSLKSIENLVREVESNGDVWIGWTAWAAGPWWPDNDHLRLSMSSTGEIPPQTKLLSMLARAKP